jgi:hypothetical protein
LSITACHSPGRSPKLSATSSASEARGAWVVAISDSGAYPTASADAAAQLRARRLRGVNRPAGGLVATSGPLRLSWWSAPAVLRRRGRLRRCCFALRRLGLGVDLRLQGAQLRRERPSLFKRVARRFGRSDADVGHLVLLDPHEPGSFRYDLLVVVEMIRAMYKRPAPSVTKNPTIAFLFSRITAAPRASFALCARA